MSEDTKNPFGDGFEEAKAGNFIKWEKIGDKVLGVLKAVRDADNYDKTGKQKVYTIEQEDGTKVQVSSRGEGFDNAMSDVLIGQKIGLMYAEDIETKKGNPFKLIKVYPGPLVDEPTKDESAKDVM